MSDRPAKEQPPPTLSNSNDNHPHGWFDDASAAIDAARMGGGMRGAVVGTTDRVASRVLAHGVATMDGASVMNDQRRVAP